MEGQKYGACFLKKILLDVESQLRALFVDKGHMNALFNFLKFNLSLDSSFGNFFYTHSQELYNMLMLLTVVTTNAIGIVLQQQLCEQ